jgi:hypothetical protein
MVEAQKDAQGRLLVSCESCNAVLAVAAADASRGTGADVLSKIECPVCHWTTSIADPDLWP